MTELDRTATESEIAELLYGLDDRLGVTTDHRHNEGVLILDNCEHLLRGVTAYLSTLLATPAHPRVLTTSREPLQITSERILPVEPLGIQATGPAAELFVDRALRSGLSPSEVDAEAVAAICRSLSGMPLAIELAAARSAVLGIGNLRDRLSDRLGTLRGGNGGHHHATIEATIDWSYQLLEPAARSGLQSLAVLLNGFDAITAEAMIGDGPVPLDTLADLVRKSLVQRSGDGFSLLETIRQYAYTRAVDEGQLKFWIQRRSLHFNERVGLLYDRAQRISLDAKERDWIRANARTIEATISIDVDQSLYASAAKLAVVLWAAMLAHSERFIFDTTTEDWFRPLLPFLGELEPQLQVGVLHGTGAFSIFRDEQTRGLALLRRSVEIAEQNRCLSRAGSITANNIGLHFVARGEWDRGIEWYERGRRHAAAVDGSGGAAIATSNVAHLKLHVFEDPSGALEVLNSIDPPSEDARNWAWLPYGLERAHVEAQLGLFAEAEKRASKVLEFLRRSGVHTEEQSRSLIILSSIALATGDVDKAIALMLEALDSVDVPATGRPLQNDIYLLDLIDLLRQIDAPVLAERVLDSMASSRSATARHIARRIRDAEISLEQRARPDANFDQSADLGSAIRNTLAAALHA